MEADVGTAQNVFPKRLGTAGVHGMAEADGPSPQTGRPSGFHRIGLGLRTSPGVMGAAGKPDDIDGGKVDRYFQEGQTARLPTTVRATL
jgi:hypothetical protein